MLDPDAVATRTFGTSFRGYDQEEVRRFLLEVAAELRALVTGALAAIDDDRAAAIVGEEAGRLLAAARATAGAAEAKGEQRAAELVREAQEEAVRLRSTVDAERERAYAEGAARAEEVLAEAERERDALLAAARSEAAQLVAEAEAARERVLQDLARRRKAVRTQVEQLHAAREELLKAMTDAGRIADDARARLTLALPEAKLAADAAARRVQAEDEVTVEQLESEIEALRLAGLSLLADVPEAEEAPEAEAEEEAPEAEVPAAEVPEPEPEPVPPRRSSSVRVFRASRGVGEPELHEVTPSAAFEEVRVVPVTVEPEPEVEEAEAEVEEPEVLADAEPEVLDEPEAAPEPVVAEEPERPDVETVDALFARLRAQREVRTAAAEEVLAEPAPEPVVVEDVAVHVGGPDRGALLARRDALLAEPTASLNRHLKRELADDQNAVLDAIRRVGPTDAVVDAAGIAARWAGAARDDLVVAARAGAAFVERDGAELPAVDDLAEELVGATAVPFAARLAEAIRSGDGDADLAADAVRSACREWRSRRLADGVELAVFAAFGRGALAAATGGDTPICWVVDDGGSPCPDAEDNALAGPVTAGDPFPTGHRHPPAHPGCRCVLAVADLAALAR